MLRRTAGGFDLATAALILSGAVLVAASLVAAAVVVFTPSGSAASVAAVADPTSTAVDAIPTAAVPANQVAAVINVDPSAGASVAARSGDHIDVLGYFSRQGSADEAVTRVILLDVPVLTVVRSAAGIALTVSVSQDAAVLLQESQALGARTFVTLRARPTLTDVSARSTSLSDADLANRLMSQP